MSQCQDIPPLLRDLAEAASTQARVANRYWLALLVTCVFVAFPDPEGGVVQLPFGLATVGEHEFALVGLLLATVITIAFCAAHAQVLRVTAFAHRIMDSPILGQMPGGHDARDFFDLLRLPAVTRVAPLPQLARGRHQFFVDKARVSQRRKWSTALYYLALKLLSIVVYFGLPVVGVVVAVARYLEPAEGVSRVAFLSWLAWPVVVAAALALVHLLVHECLHIIKAARAMTSSQS